MNWMKHGFIGLIAALTISVTWADVPYLEATQLRKIEPSSSVLFGFAGRSVSLDSGRSLIGAPGYRNSAAELGGGAFVHQGPIWSSESLLTPSVETGDDAGHSVSFSGSIAVVGVPKNDDSGPDQGKVILFAYDSGRRAWLPFQELTAPQDYRYPIYFGWSVSLDGNRLLVGAPAGTNAFSHGSEVGTAYIYEPDNTGEWLPVETFTGPETGDLFGYSVSLQGSRAIVGAPCANSGGGLPVRSGSAYTFERRTGTSWPLDEKIEPSAPAAGDAFGFSVDLDSSRALIGAPNNNSARGTVGLFQKQLVAGWSHLGTFESDTPQDGEFFGFSVSIDGDLFVVGCPNRRVGGIATGATFPFWRTGGSWVRQALFVSDDAANNDSFGTAVSLEGTQVLVGAPFDNETLDNSGAAFLFNIEEKNANKPPTGITLSGNSIAENSPNGAAVGTLSTNDPNVGQTFTYELLNDAGGRFSLGGASNDQILVSGALDFEIRPGHTIQIRTTDDCGLPFTQDLSISVIDVETPVTITLANLTQTYIGSPLDASYTTSPAGVPVEVVYATLDGSAPTNAGQYLVTASASPASDYSGMVSGTLTINQAAATITLGNLNQTYDGTPRTVTSSTTPAGLPVSITYDGSTTPPVNAGNYQVAAMITDQNYLANSITRTLFVSKAQQTITFPQPADMRVLETQELLATASSGLPVSYSVTPQAGLEANVITPLYEGVFTVTTMQSGNENFNPAPVVSRNINVGQKANLILPSEPGRAFGFQMDLWQDRLAILQIDDIAPNPSSSGKVFLFEKSVAGSWEETQMITAQSISSIAIFENLLAVAGPLGPAEIYQRNDATSWAALDFYPHQDDRFVSISNNIIYSANYDEARATIHLPGSGWWTSEPLLPSGGEAIGAIDSWGETCVVACRSGAFPFTTREDIIYLFERQDNGQWTETKRIEQPSNTIAISGDFLAIGNEVSHGLSVEYLSQIETVVYHREDGDWSREATLVPAGSVANSSPKSLSFFGKYLLIGVTSVYESPTTIFPFIRNQAGEWIQQDALAGANRGDGFGYGAAVWGRDVVVGAPLYDREDEDGNSNGMACSFEIVSVNSLPSNIALSTNSVTEGLPADSVVGRLSTTDPDPADTFFRYELVPGPGSDDNEAFRIGVIRSDRLMTNATFDFGEKSTCQIRIRSTDVRGASVEEAFIVNIVDEPDPATIQLSDLIQIYDGTLKHPTITTSPAGLDFKTTFTGGSKPIEAGTYPFIVAINQAGYFGSASGSLVIGKASQEITLGIPDPVVICEYIQGPAQKVSAFSSSGLPLILTSSDSSVLAVQPGPLGSWGIIPSTPGFATITATQSGSSNYHAASGVVATVEVITRFTEMVLPESVTEIMLGDTRHNSLALDGDILMTGGDLSVSGTFHRRNSPGDWTYLRDSNSITGVVAASDNTYVGIPKRVTGTLKIFCGDTNLNDDPPITIDLDLGLATPIERILSTVAAGAVEGNFLLVKRHTYAPYYSQSPLFRNESHQSDVFVFAREPDCEWTHLSTCRLGGVHGAELLDQMTAEEKLRARALFGHHIAMDDETVLLSAFTKIFVARIDSTGIELLDLLPDTRDTSIGSLAIEGDIAAVGYYVSEENEFLPGVVDIYERNPEGEWNLSASLTPPNPNFTGRFGWDVDLSNGILAVAGFGYYEVPGEAYLFEKNTGGSWEKLFRIPVDSTYIVDVEIDGDTVAVIGGNGIPGQNGNKITIFELDRPESLPLESITNGIFAGIPQNSPLRNLLADPDDDGNATLLEIATGTDPFRPDKMTPGDDTLPFFSLEDGHMPVMNFTVPNPVPQVRYLVECSSTLQDSENWHRIAPDSVRTVHKGVSHTTIEMRFAPLPEGRREFFRLVVEALE